MLSIGDTVKVVDRSGIIGNGFGENVEVCVNDKN